MRSRRVTLLDIGLDDDFDASMNFVQSALKNMNVAYGEKICDIDFVRSRDPYTVGAAFTSSCDVLHVMAQGDHEVTPTFSSTDGKTSIGLADLGSWAAITLQSGVSTGAVLADGCKTGTGVWRRAVRDCLAGPITYIGTSAAVGWHEGAVFCSAFYGALFRNKGKGRSSAQQARDAAERAIKAYESLTDRSCPYKVYDLEPSRNARRALA